MMMSSIVMESFVGTNRTKSLSAAVWASFLLDPGLPIEATADMAFAWSEYASNEQRNAVVQASSHTSLVAHPAAGGRFANVTEWVHNVDTTPVPIKTTLTSVNDLMPAHLKNTAQVAWAELLTMCPRGVDGTICSNHGSCNWQQHSCSCVDHFSGDACEIFDCEVTCKSRYMLSHNFRLLVFAFVHCCVACDYKPVTSHSYFHL
jgi:hypothetical protein